MAKDPWSDLGIPKYLKRKPPLNPVVVRHDSRGRPEIIMPKGDGQNCMLLPKNVEPEGLRLFREITEAKKLKQSERLADFVTITRRKKEAERRIKKEATMAKVAEIIEEYNRLASESGLPLVKKFESLAVGQKRLEKLKNGGVKAPKATKAPKASDKTAKATKAPKASDKTAKATKEPKASDKTAKEEKSQSRRVGGTIVLLTPKNPKKEGSKGAAHFEACRGKPTVAEFVARFPGAERNARVWLHNFVEEGSVKIES